MRLLNCLITTVLLITPFFAHAEPTERQFKADMLFAYVGNWLAEPESPAGMQRTYIYASPNQEGYYAAKGVQLAVDDFFFLWPTQSEAVLLQFGDLVGIRRDRIEQRWPVLPVGL